MIRGRGAQRDLATPVRVALLAVPVLVGTFSVFVLRRLDQGEWDLEEPVIVVFIAVALLAPGAVFLVALVRDTFLYLVGLLSLCASMLLGIGLAAVGGGDGQAGINLLATPAVGFGAALLLGWFDRARRSDGTGSGARQGGLRSQ